jgi:hypothetical protein
MAKSTLATLQSTHESTHQGLENKGNPRLPRFNARALRAKNKTHPRAISRARTRKPSVASVASVDFIINHHVSNTVMSGYSVDSSVDSAKIHLSLEKLTLKTIKTGNPTAKTAEKAGGQAK